MMKILAIQSGRLVFIQKTQRRPLKNAVNVVLVSQLFKTTFCALYYCCFTAQG